MNTTMINIKNIDKKKWDIFKKICEIEGEVDWWKKTWSEKIRFLINLYLFSKINDKKIKKIFFEKYWENLEVDKILTKFEIFELEN